MNMLSLIRPSQKSVSSLQICFKSLSISSVQCKDEKPKGLIEKILDSDVGTYFRPFLSRGELKIWNERRAIKQAKKFKMLFNNDEDSTETLRRLQSLGNFPRSVLDLVAYIRRKRVRNMMLEQKFIRQRHAILKPDLAAAHFILGRGGSVKFESKNFWIGPNNKNIKIPATYIPGFYVEGINAENTNLYYDGFKNLCDLRRLKWLSLKGLEEVDDWCMDYISKEYSRTLEYLDLTDCKNVTYRGLSCFYRFENLKTLIVQGVPDAVEFKLACIMLQDIMPELDIQGINLSIPDQINPVETADVAMNSPALEK